MKNKNFEKLIEKSIEFSASSNKEAEFRVKMYEALAERAIKLNKKSMHRTMSFAATETYPDEAISISLASIAAQVTSFAGFLTAERLLEKQTEVITLVDTVGYLNPSEAAVPSIGLDDYTVTSSDLDTVYDYNTPSTGWDTTSSATINVNQPLTPRSVKLTFNFFDWDSVNSVYIPSNIPPITVYDDGQGSLMSPAGFLSQGNVTYSNGTITINIDLNFLTTLGLTPNGTDVGLSISLEAARSVLNTGINDPQNDAIQLVFNRDIFVTASDDTITIVTNEFDVFKQRKELNTNPDELLVNKLMERYRIKINNKIASMYRQSYSGDTTQINMTGYTPYSAPNSAGSFNPYDHYEATLNAFKAGLIQVDNVLSKKIGRKVTASAYLVGETVATAFELLGVISDSSFEPAPAGTYFNGLVGMYKGRPILRHTSVPEAEGFAIFRSPDDVLAPVIRGNYLPPTLTDKATNRENPVEFARTLYYIEGHKYGVPEFVHKFSVIANNL